MFEKQVCVGGNMANFREIFSMADRYGAAVTVNSADEMARYISSPLPAADFSGFFAEMDARQEGIMARIKGVISDVSSD